MQRDPASADEPRKKEKDGAARPKRAATIVDIDHAYFINLASRTDRLLHMQATLSRCPWPSTRIDAVRLEKPAEELGYRLVPRLHGSTHVVSIWLSHRKLLETALQAPGDGAIVLLEDDVQIKDDFWSRRIRLPRLPSNWQLAILSPRYRRTPASTAPGESKWVKAPFGRKPVQLSTQREFISTGAHFVIFRDRSVVRSVIEKMDAVSEMFDVDLLYHKRTVAYGLHDERISAGGFGSDHHD